MKNKNQQVKEWMVPGMRSIGGWNKFSNMSKNDKYVYKCLKMHQNSKTLPTNGPQLQKWQKIANNYKISEITKYGA